MKNLLKLKVCLILGLLHFAFTLQAAEMKVLPKEMPLEVAKAEMKDLEPAKGLDENEINTLTAAQNVIIKSIEQESAPLCNSICNCWYKNRETGQLVTVVTWCEYSGDSCGCTQFCHGPCY